MISIDVVTRESPQLEEFLSVPSLVYRNDTHYCSPPKESVLGSVWRREFAERQRVFLAKRGGVAAARLVARISHELCDGENRPRGLLGFFESANDAEASRALFDEAASWLTAAGVKEILGPMDGDTWHRYRLNNGPFDEPPFLMEPYNPTYYNQLWLSSGFVPYEGYHSKRVDDVGPVVQKFGAIQQRTLDHGYRLQPFDRDRFDRELERLYELSLLIFAENRLYTAISPEEFRSLYLPVKSLIDPDLVWFGRSPTGEDVGFLFAICDYHAALVAMRGNTGLLGKVRFWLRARSSHAINIKSMGVVPGHRRSGVGVALVQQVYTKMLERGYRTANLCLIHDSNPSSRLDGGYGKVLRRYTLYRRMSAG